MCELDTKATGSRPRSHESGGYTGHRVSSSSNSRGGWGAPGTLTAGHGPGARLVTHSCTPETPLGSLAGRRRLKGGRWAPPQLPTCSSSLEGCGPVRRSQSGHIHTWASGPSSTTTDLCPFKSRHHQILAPPQEAVPLQDWPSRPGGSKETAEHRRPEKQIPPAELRKSQGSFP